jgi:hypothetical protein
VADLVVDLDGLSALAGALQRIESRLASVRTELRGAGPELSDPQVADALERFESRWRDGRKDIADNAEALATMLSESVRTYRRVDAELGSAVSGAVTQGAAIRGAGGR